MVIILISSLPDDYNFLITALETIAEEKLTWDYVHDRLLHEFDKMQRESTGKVGSDISQDALFSRNATERKPGDMKKFKCHYCKRKGHFAKDCFKRKANEKQHHNQAAAHRIESIKSPDDYDNPEIALVTDHGLPEYDEWWIDSGASQHMTFEKKGLRDYVEFKDPRRVKLADNSILLAYGKGSLRFSIYDGTERVELFLSDVLFVPKIQNKLLSLPVMTEKGASVQFKGQLCELIVKDKHYTIGHKEGKLFKLNTEPAHKSCFGSCNGNVNSLQMWHFRYGHLGYDNLKLLKGKSMVDGLAFDPKDELNVDCEGCAMGKLNRLPFPKKSNHRSSQLLELIHTDVCGPMNVESIGGSRYFVSFIDDYSRYVTVYMIKNKSEVLSKFKEFVSLMENLTEHRIKVLRSDNGGEYESREFTEYCQSHGIKRETTIPYTPQQNGVVERMNRTLLEAVRSMLHHAGLPLRFWAEAVSTAAYLRNQSPTVQLKDRTPYECIHKRKPEIGHLKVFGCNSYVQVPEQKRSKLDKKAIKCIFVGYSQKSKGYKFYNPDTHKMLLSRDAIFLESRFGNSELAKETGIKERPLFIEKSETDDVVYFDDRDPETIHEGGQERPIEDNEAQNNQPDVIVRRSQRQTIAPDRLGAVVGDWWNYASVAISAEDEPKNLNEAFNSKSSKYWKEAVEDEYQSFLKNNTWELVKRPKDKNVITCKWVFKVKRKANGSVDRYKARLVAQGYSQEEGEDYDDTFAPVARYSSIRSILAVANQLNLEVHQMDVKTAYLNGDLEREIYMEQPEGYVDKDQTDLVCRLRKSLYGLKQSARCWNITIDSFLKESGYVQSNADPCVYFKTENKDGKKECLMIIALYVDDMVLATNDTTMLEKEKSLMKERFEMEDRGEIHYCLGMSITRDRASKILKINQRAYLENVLKRFQMFECKPVSTPMEIGKRFEKLKDGENTTSQKEYQAAIGSLTYAAIATRPDISYAVGVLSQFMSFPGQVHFQ